MDEQQAILSLKQGDPGGLEYLVRAHQLHAIRTAFLILGDRGLAEDVVQDAFVRLFQSIRGFDTSRPFLPWFMRSVVNAALKSAGRLKREASSSDPEAERAFARRATQRESLEAQLEATQTEQELQLALDRLSPRQRTVLVQRYYLEMSEAEMAATSGTAAGTIKWLLNAARRRLRGILVERSE